MLLCAPFSNIRLNALDCLSSAATIVGHFAEDDDMPAQRVHDIITEAAPDVVQRLHQDYLFRLKNPSINPCQTCWSTSSAASRAVANCAGRSAWPICSSRSSPSALSPCGKPGRLCTPAVCFAPARSDAPQPLAHAGGAADRVRVAAVWRADDDKIDGDVGLQYGSNYILFACAAAQTPEEPRVRLLCCVLLSC